PRRRGMAVARQQTGHPYSWENPGEAPQNESERNRDGEADQVPDVVIAQGDVYKLLKNRTYAGEAAHKGRVYPGEHEAIVPRELWDRVHDLLGESPRVRGNRSRAQSPALLKGLIFGADGRALSPTHTRRRGRLYRYYVAQRVLKADGAEEGCVRRVSAAEIE